MTTTSGSKRRITQRQIAQLAGVSQSTVSLVVNGKAEALSRIPAATRDRVLEVIREAEYVADPVARSLAGHGNHLIGVFTYEPAFPTASLDFYTSLLTGIEAEAEHLGYDLLLFTSAPVQEGKRSVFHPYSRIRLADGCLLLGREMEGEELERMVASGFPFVAVGRRDTPGVPYVAVDYAAGTSALVERAWEHGHRDFALLHVDSTGESTRDRRTGFEDALARLDSAAAARATAIAVDPADHAAAWAALRSSGATVAFIEAPADAIALHKLAGAEGVSIPDDLSFVVLADPSRSREGGPDFTRLSPPRARLGAESLALLSRLLDPELDVPEHQRRLTLDCALTDGATLVPPRPTTSASA
ncbi:LacI family DNA-binding transcriptional regulator [uncultured Demequina sp.]|uniref:LacI family DNA-binding transcriptional regulator n=1 Tax=uncultured Demequina sp. TaxID=693499 RepID=UPI0025F36A5E|nr:LacI family DNA-binding transcriptional regulator [uncultured Demequina sp.]